MDWRLMLASIVMNGIGLGAVAAYMQVYNSDASTYCMGHYPWQFWTGVLLSITVPYGLLIRKLHSIKDKIGMGNEIARTLFNFYVFASTYFVFIALMANGVLPVDTRIHVFIIVMQLVIMTDVNVVSRLSWSEIGGAKARQRIKGSMRCAVDAVCDKMDEYSAKWVNSTQIMKSPALNAAFAVHVERCLCYESYRFLADAMEYTSNTFDTPQEQARSHHQIRSGSILHAAFNKIVTTYIIVNSTFEVLDVRDQAVFIALDAEKRRTVFRPVAAEVARLLDQNLIASFKRTSQFQKACMEQEQLDAVNAGAV
ncbi:hypothetical protein JKP88DRAFT_248410 [Tribonema minus]|uniref:RGS domain-containing protein n=1 Tax=Tribonema minus TaxID=303371 RepID=A0A835YQR1_9STRA|nr:hypothetical protein JKP88DRAFT_248410 [Tribonema minus]